MSRFVSTVVSKQRQIGQKKADRRVFCVLCLTGCVCGGGGGGGAFVNTDPQIPAVVHQLYIRQSKDSLQ